MASVYSIAREAGMNPDKVTLREFASYFHHLSFGLVHSSLQFYGFHSSLYSGAVLPNTEYVLS